jgi:DNA-directed RNA polymerase specialized sigma24 family protein
MKNQERQDYFEAVYRETFKRLSQFVFFKVAEPSEAEDVIASVYMDFYRYVVLRGKHPENILAYLMKMANHELSRHYKNNPHQISFDQEIQTRIQASLDDQTINNSTKVAIIKADLREKHLADKKWHSSGAISHQWHGGNA